MGLRCCKPNRFEIYDSDKNSVFKTKKFNAK